MISKITYVDYDNQYIGCRVYLFGILIYKNKYLKTKVKNNTTQ